MRQAARSLLLLFLLPAAATAQDNRLPRLIVQAKYVFITTYHGDPVGNGRVMPEDRQAALDVENAIKRWGRYVVVTREKDADLILLVRKGRIVGALPGVRIGGGSDRPASVSPDVVMDAGDPLDILAVYDAFHGIDTAPLWRGRMRDGLNGPEVRLVKEFREKVEAAAKTP